MLRRMLGKKKGKMVTFLGGIGYCYGDCSDYNVTSINSSKMHPYNDPNAILSISVGDQIDSSIVWEIKQHAGDGFVGFNCTRITSSSTCSSNSSSPSFQAVNRAVRFRILSDFYIDISDKEWGWNIKGEIEILPEYQA